MTGGSILALITFSICAGYCLIMALGQLTSGKGMEQRVNLAVFWSSFGGFLLLSGFQITKVTETALPQLFFLDTPLLYATGPGIYLFFKRTARSTNLPLRAYILHYLPAFIAMLAILPVLGEDAATKIEMDRRAYQIMLPEGVALLNFGPGEFRQALGRDFFNLVLILCKASGISYLTVLILNSFYLSETQQQFERHRWAMGVAAGLLILAGFLGILDHFVLTGLVAQIAMLLTSFVFLLFYLLDRKFLIFRLLADKSFERLPERRRGLESLPLDETMSRLRELMESEKLYRDDEISLNSMAAVLKLKPYQLSRILNESYGAGFHRFINGYRIQDAQELLLRDPERSVLSVAMEVGFNSKSAFNRVFREISGTTPMEFRRAGTKKRS